MKIDKLLSQKQIDNWSEIFNKSLALNCIGEAIHRFMQTILGSSEPIEMNLKLTNSKRNAHFISVNISSFLAIVAFAVSLFMVFFC